MDTLTKASLIERRKALGLNIDQVAKEAGLPPSTLSRIEAGKVGGTITSWKAILGALDRFEADPPRAAVGSFPYPHKAIVETEEE